MSPSVGRSLGPWQRFVTHLAEFHVDIGVRRHSSTRVRAVSKANSPSLQELPFWSDQLKPLLTIPLLPEASDSEAVTSVLPSSVVERGNQPPAVTKILSESQDDEAFFRLMQWRKRKIKELGKEGFEQLNRETLNRGTSFHSLVHRFLEDGQPPDEEFASPQALRLFKSALPQLRRVEKYVNGEVFSTNPVLFYRGKIDTIVVLDGELTLVEWKTSSRRKPTLDATYDAPLQAAAYVGALNRDPDLILLASGRDQGRSIASISSSSSPTVLKRARIVVCYDDGSPATPHDLPLPFLEEYWKLWRERLVTYWMRSITNDRIAEAVKAVGRNK